MPSIFYDLKRRIKTFCPPLMSDSPQTWKCPGCGFWNAPTEVTCLMCNTPMEKPAAKKYIPISPPPAPEEPPKKKAKPDGTDKPHAKAVSTAKGKAKKGKKPKSLGKAYKAGLAKLEAFLLSPASSTEEMSKRASHGESGKVTVMAPQKVKDLLRRYVPNINELYDRRHTCPVTDLILKTYSNGLPLYDRVPAIKEHTKHSIQYIFYALDSKEMNYSENDKRVYLRRLAEAFTSCQAGQARELDAVYGSLIGRSLDLRGQVLSLVDEQKQRVLDMVTKKIHPDAWESMDPTRQAPHIESAYVQLFGRQFGLRGTNGAGADYCMASVSKTEAERAEKEFRKLFSVEETLESIIMDVNQQNRDADRIISREDLSKWAGNAAENGGFDSWSIFYDEENKDDYPEDAKPTEENMYQPFLSKKVALNLLLKLFKL